MKPVFANCFMVTVNPSGECVLNIMHNYPITGVDEKTKAVVLKEGFDSEVVASIVMTHVDAQNLANVLNNTLGSLKQAEQLATRQGGTMN